MCRRELPRVYELIDLVDDRTAPSAYFQNFESSIHVEREKKQVWLSREEELQGLDLVSWKFLKEEARRYLMRRDPKRGWQQLITILNQTRAYGYLQKSVRCTAVRFIPRGKKKTPDLEGELNGCRVLLEVKTINISDKEASARCSGNLRMVSDQLGCGFFNKLRSDLEGAKVQMEACDSGENARRIIFVVPNFDDSLGEYKEGYYSQIDDYLGQNPTPGTEIVFYNQRTAFHSQVAMRHATVINE